MEQFFLLLLSSLLRRHSRSCLSISHADHWNTAQKVVRFSGILLDSAGDFNDSLEEGESVKTR